MSGTSLLEELPGELMIWVHSSQATTTARNTYRIVKVINVTTRPGMGVTASAVRTTP